MSVRSDGTLFSEQPYTVTYSTKRKVEVIARCPSHAETLANREYKRRGKATAISILNTATGSEALPQ